MPFTQRSEATRTAILDAARELLTEHGYQGTTIRAVAARVGVDPSMVMRYYGNKEGLFRAAVTLDLRLHEIPVTVPGRLGEVVARHFVSRWEGDLADEAIMLLLRSASTNELAAEQLRAIFDEQVTAFVAGVAPGGPEEASRRAGLVSAQLLGLALTRYFVRLAPVVAMDAEDVVRAVGPSLQRYLTGSLDG